MNGFDQKTLLHRLYRAIALLTVMSVLMSYGVQVITPVYAAQLGEAESFLQSLQWIPYHPFVLTSAVVMTGAGMLLGGKEGRRENPKAPRDGWQRYLTQAVLFGAASLLFQQNCDKIALFAIADRLDDANTRRQRNYLTVMTILYLLCNLDFFTDVMHAVSLQQYLNFYERPVRSILQLIIEGLSAVGAVLFVLYLVVFMVWQVREKLEVQQRNRKLEEMNGQLLDYAEERAHTAQVQERNRLAREIHDTLGHVLTGIAAGTDACLQMLDDSPELARKQMELIADTARDGMQEVRRSVNALRPDSLEQQSLSVVLDRMCANMGAGTGTEVRLEENLAGEKLMQDEEDAVYRTVQEGITNAIRHGHATRIEVRCLAGDGRMTIEVRDNGSGCGKVVPGFGLRHMQERMSMLGGGLQYESRDGFCIRAEFPLRRRKERQEMDGGEQ